MKSEPTKRYSVKADFICLWLTFQMSQEGQRGALARIGSGGWLASLLPEKIFLVKCIHGVGKEKDGNSHGHKRKSDDG